VIPIAYSEQCHNSNTKQCRNSNTHAHRLSQYLKLSFNAAAAQIAKIRGPDLIVSLHGGAVIRQILDEHGSATLWKTELSKTLCRGCPPIRFSGALTHHARLVIKPRIGITGWQDRDAKVVYLPSGCALTANNKASNRRNAIAKPTELDYPYLRLTWVFKDGTDINEWTV